jgi:hypothetical protein
MMKLYLRNVALGIIFGLLCGLLLGAVAPRPAHSRDNGQWEGSDPEIRKWYQSLMQPDVPTLSCCGEADAYWCDEIHVKGDKAYCRITDTRPDAPLGRPHREIGEEYEIPPNKLKHDAGNPTGHSIIFLSSAGYTWCFVQAGGV